MAPIVVTIGDGQVVAVAVAIYGVAVAFTGKVIMHLVDKNTALEQKVDRIQHEMNALHLEVRELTRHAVEALKAISPERDA